MISDVDVLSASETPKSWGAVAQRQRAGSGDQQRIQQFKFIACRSTGLGPLFALSHASGSDQDEQHDEYQAQSPARVIPPSAAVGPRWQGTQ